MADNPNYPVSTAAINWFDTSGQLHMRIYSCDGYTAIERCNEGQGWTTGSFSQPAGSVSATCWTTSSGPSIRVYCTNDDATTEWCTDPNAAWYQGSYTVS